MADSLKVTVAQPPCLPDDVEANAVAHAEAVRSSDARVVVFPETSLTGYGLAATAINLEDPRLHPIVEACTETGAIALAGAPVAGDNGDEYLAMLAIDQAGVSVAYRKVWLHPPEDERFVAGPGPVVLEVDGWRLGLAICQDTMVPDHARDTAAPGMDVYVAGAVSSPAGGLRRAERMRSIASGYGVWVALAEFAGPTDGFPQTLGGSSIWAPGGELAATTDAAIGRTVTMELRR